MLKKTPAHSDPAELEILRQRIAELEARAARAEEAERCLLDSRERYRSLMEHAGDAIFLADEAGGRILDCNRRAEQLIGRHRDEIIGRTQRELGLPPLLTRAAQPTEGQVTRADGATARVEITVSVHALPGQRLIQAIVRDVTEKHQLALEMRRNEATIDSIFRAAPVGIGLVRERIFLRVNERICQMTGYSEAELVGHGARLVYPTDEEFEWVGREKYRQIAVSGMGAVETRWRRKDGTILQVLLSSTPLDPADLAAGVTFTVLDITERKQAERDREQAWALLEAAVLESPSGIIVADAPDVTVRLANPAAIAIGVRPGDALGNPVAPESRGGWRLLRPDGTLYQAEELPLARAVLQGTTIRNEELVIRNADGVQRWLSVNAAPVRTRNNEISAGIVVFHDITERKCMEVALRESEQRFRVIAEQTGHMFYDWDFTSPSIHWAGAITALTGFTPAEYQHVGIGEWEQMIHPDDRARAVSLLKEAEHGDGAYRAEYRLRRNDGSYLYVEDHGAFLRDGRGRTIRMLGTMEDITQRKQAEAQLREKQRTLEVLMSNLPGMAYRCRNDARWTMDFVSDGCRDLTGYAPEDLRANRRVSYASLIRPDYAELVWNAVNGALLCRQSFEITYPIRTAGGEEKWVWEKGRGVFDADARLLFLEGIICDVTAQHRAEQEREKLEALLRQSQKMEAVGQLAGGVAHDFNNLLTAIFGNVETALREANARAPANAALLEAVQQIECSAQRAARLTRQLLAFSRRQVMRPHLLDLYESLRDCEKLLRRLITEDITLDLVLAPALPTIEVDPGQLEQIVMNLVINARDALPLGGRLVLETNAQALDEAYLAVHPEARPGPHVMLAVSDTGCGMDGATLERIFEPFFTTKPMGQGSGLGLATVYGIVKQAGGHICVYSEPGRGSCFKVYVPAVAGVPASAAAPASAEQANCPGGSETILLCEDDATVRDLTAQLLRDAGYTVLAARDAGQAQQLSRERPQAVHLLLTDVVMPDLNGKQLSDALRAGRPALRTLFVSGYTSNVIAHHGVVDSEIDFLEKPYSRRQLLRKVREVLDRTPAAPSAGA